MSHQPRPLPFPAIQPVMRGLILWLRLDERSGARALDRSGKGVQALLYGPTWVAGRRGSALYFNGLNDYVSAGNILPESQVYTFIVWVKTTQTSPDNDTAVRLITILRTTTGTKITLAMRANKAALMWHNGTAFKNLKSPLTYNDGSWHHIVGVTDGTSFLVYVDGVQVASTTSTFTSLTTTATDLIGSAAGGVGFFSGTIGEVRVYNRALNAAEIKRHYESELMYTRA